MLALLSWLGPWEGQEKAQHITWATAGLVHGVLDLPGPAILHPSETSCALK